MRPHWLALFVVLAAGCSGPEALSTDDYRTRIPALQERVAAAPRDVAALNDLGEALAQSGDFDGAYGALLAAERLAPGDARRSYYLGLVEEALGNPDEAAARYQDAPPTSPYRRQMDERAALLQREAARADGGAGPSAEGAGAAVAVLPFVYRGDDPLYRPLGRGLSELLAADLAATGRVRVVDGLRVSGLVDELGLDPTAIAEAEAQRLGALLRSRHVVVGTFEVQNDVFSAEAELVPSDRAPAPEVAGVDGPIADLFRLEKELAAGLLRSLGVALTAPEQERLAGVPTGDLYAFLLYSRGLLEEDAGRFDEALALYASAASLDPGFVVAGDRADAVGARRSADRGIAGALAALRVVDARPGAEDLAARRLAALGQSLGAHVVPGEGARDPAAEGAPTTRAEPFPAPPPPPTSGGN